MHKQSGVCTDECVVLLGDLAARPLDADPCAVSPDSYSSLHTFYVYFQLDSHTNT